MEKRLDKQMDNANISQDNFRREEVIEEENNCCICGTDLDFRHKINHYNRTITEDASCSVCGIRNRTRTHILH